MIFIEHPQSIYVKGLDKRSLPIIRCYLITPDGKIYLAEEYPKLYPKERKKK